ncbi:MAG TPA: hypothetical protein VHV54_20125, partial [Candidatus Binatia bacterium]|nr:hypothetical protein [Candidatus Binatia bacterium]
MISYVSILRRVQFIGTIGVLLLAMPMLVQSQEKPPAAPQGEKPAPNVQPAPTTVPGRPDIPNAEVAKQ